MKTKFESVLSGIIRVIDCTIIGFFVGIIVLGLMTGVIRIKYVKPVYTNHDTVVILHREFSMDTMYHGGYDWLKQAGFSFAGFDIEEI